MTTDALQDSGWEILKNDFVRGHHPEQLILNLMVTEEQKPGTWCSGQSVLDSLHKSGEILVGAASSPKYFPMEWQGYEIAIFGTRYFQKGASRQVPHIRIYTFKDGAWSYRMESLEEDFNILLGRRKNLRIAVFKLA